jgi:ubiquinone/menaquinone biosynthesis C-methylase UbiE
MLFMPVLRYDRLGSEDVNGESESKASGILPVPRTKEEAKRSYDRISKYYDYLTGAFERRYAEMALERLSIVEGETVLEIGFGTGHCLKRIAEFIGQMGKVYGIDISSGMMEITKRRLEKAGLAKRAELYCGDAASLPFEDNTFDAVFTSFTLELFDTPQIPKVLEQIKRVLKPGGRLGVASMSKENGASIFLRLYEWIHNKWPKYVDCRPLYVEQSLIDAGYQIKSAEKVKLFRLPMEIIVAINTISGSVV